MKEAVTTLIRPVLLRKHLPTRTFRCHHTPYLCGVLELFPVSGPTCAVSSCFQIHMIHGKYACMVYSQFHEKFWASDKETRTAIMKSGYMRTLLVTGYAQHACHQKKKQRDTGTTKKNVRTQTCRSSQQPEGTQLGESGQKDKQLQFVPGRRRP